MQNLREIGSRYNELQDALDAQKAALRESSSKEERRVLRQGAAEKRSELKRFKASLSGEARQAYKDYRAIRREIRHCERLKRCDKAESRIFHKVNPAYIYIFPAAFHAIFFTLMPFLFMIVGAFFKLDLVDIKSSKFVGWWNFKMVLVLDNEFWRAFVNTIIFAIVTVFLLMVVTVLMSSWLSKNTKIHNLAQTMIFTPHISSMVAVGILWVLMLDPQGIINQILAIFRIKGPNWLMDSRTSLFSVDGYGLEIHRLLLPDYHCRPAIPAKGCLRGRKAGQGEQVDDSSEDYTSAADPDAVFCVYYEIHQCVQIFFGHRCDDAGRPSGFQHGAGLLDL